MTAALLPVAALALLVLPGVAICLAAGLRWVDAVAAGPALTLAVVAVGCAVTSAADVAWAPPSALVAALALLLGAGLVGLATRRRRVPDGADALGAGPGDADPGDGGPVGWRTVLAVVVLSLLPALQVVVATRGLTSIPQGWDTLLHGGATRFIAETGRAGLTDLAPVSQPANPGFYYPDTYHALVSLLLHLPGAGTPGALNGLPGALDAMSAVTGVVFVVGVAVLTWRLSGGSRAAAVGAALVGASCWTFPYLALGAGPVLPFALGVAIIPGLMVLGERVAGWRGGFLSGTVAPALLLGAGMAGAWSVHPSVALAAAIPVGIQALAGLVAAPGPRPRLAVLGGFALAAVAAALYVGWAVSAVSSGTTDALAGFSWPRDVGVARAVARVFDLGPTAVSSIGITVFVVAGLAASVAVPRLRRPLAAVVATLGVYGALYVLAAAVEGEWVRLFTGYWWDDARRFSSLLVVPTAVLAGVGVRALIPRGSLRRPAARLGVTVVALCALAVASAQAVLARDLQQRGYRDGPAVTAAEREVLDRLAELYDDDGVVLNDPFDGTAWVYALYGVPVVFGTPLADDPEAQVGQERMTLYTSMNRYGFDPTVTDVVRRLDVRWVVVGTGVVGGPGRPGGFIGLHHNPHLRLVAENEGARVYEVLPVPADHLAEVPPEGIPASTPPWQPENTDSPIVDAVPPGGATTLGGTG